MSMSPRIIGWGHTAFGKFDQLTLEDLIRNATQEAMDCAGLGPSDIDAIFVGHFNGGFVRQDFTGSLVAVALPEFRYTPSVRVENACATGSAAIWAALDALESGRIRTALIVGVEKMNTLPSSEIGSILLKCSHVPTEGDTPGGFAGVFGKIATEYFQRFGDQTQALASIAAKNHRNGAKNPLAHMRKDLGVEFCLIPSEKNPQVAGPLKRSDCSLVSDGAAAIVVSTGHLRGIRHDAVKWRARSQVNDFLPLSKRDPTQFVGAAFAWRKGMAEAGISLRDLNFVETHDCFTIAELLEYEAMGLAPHGQGASVILNGETTMEGWLPINPSGGLKSRGHPIGATGVSQHVMAAMQLVGAAGDMQVADARLGAVFNMGGAAVTNYLSVLEAV